MSAVAAAADLPLLVPAPPRVAHKRARLVEAGGRVFFAALSAPVCYRTAQAAACAYCDHAAPDPRCTCGFWGVEDPWQLDDVAGPRRSGEAFLVVELSGTSVAYARGARAERQRVLGVGIDGWCAECLAAGRVRCATRVARFTGDRGPFLWSVCARHARGALRTYTADELALLMRMPVVLDWSQRPSVDRRERMGAALADRAPLGLAAVLVLVALLVRGASTGDLLVRIAGIVAAGATGALAHRQLAARALRERLERTPPPRWRIRLASVALLTTQLVVGVLLVAT